MAYAQGHSTTDPLSGRPLVLTLGAALLFAALHGTGSLAYVAHYLATGETYRVIDYISFHMAADAVLNQGLSPYGDATIAQYRETLGFRVYPFLYPPYALPLMAPFAALGYQEGAIALLAINLAAAAGLFCLLHRAFLAQLDGGWGYWVGLCLLVAHTPVGYSIFMGQVNLLVTLALVGAWLLMRDGRRPLLAGALLGLAIVLKTYFVLLLLLLLLRGMWRPLIAALLLVGIMSLLALATMPASLWQEWLYEVAPSGGYGSTPFPDVPIIMNWNQSFHGVLIRLLGAGELTRLWGYALAVPTLAVALAVLWRNRAAADAAYVDGGFALLLVTIYLVAPLSWMHHLVFLLPAVLWLWRETFRGGGVRSLAAAGGAGVLLAMHWPIQWLADVSPVLTLLPFLVVLAFWAVTLRQAARASTIRVGGDACSAGA